MEREKRIKEVGDYLDSHYIPGIYDDIVMDQEMKSIFNRITAFRKKRAEQKKKALDADMECMDDLEEGIDFAPGSPIQKKMEEISAPAFDESNYTKKKLSNPLHETYVTSRRIDDLMEQMEETFTERLLRMIDERNLIESEVYKKAYVDRRHFSKIKKDVNYSPNKKTVFAFAIALELSIDETKDLLQCAGYALSRSSRFDIIVAYFLQNKIYDMFEINDILYAYEQPIFE